MHERRGITPSLEPGFGGWLGGMAKGMSLNSALLTPKPLASSIYVRAPEAPSPRQRAISVASLFPSSAVQACFERIA